MSDTCPGQPDPDQADADDDRVGDVCDPAGSLDGLRCFTDFGVGTNVDRVFAFTGAWSHSGSSLVHAPADEAPLMIATQVSGLPSTNFAVQTELTFDSADLDFAAGIGVGPTGTIELQRVIGRSAGLVLEVRLFTPDGRLYASPLPTSLEFRSG